MAERRSRKGFLAIRKRTVCITIFGSYVSLGAPPPPSVLIRVWGMFAGPERHRFVGLCIVA